MADRKSEQERLNKLREDARRRDATIPPQLAHFNNEMIGGRGADYVDALGAAAETYIGNKLRGEENYSPSEAGREVFATAGERGERFVREHPGQARALDIMADVAREAIAKRLKALPGAASVLSGAADGAQGAEPGARTAGGVSGAMEALVLDAAVGKYIEAGNLPEAAKDFAGALISSAAKTGKDGLDRWVETARKPSTSTARASTPPALRTPAVFPMPYLGQSSVSAAPVRAPKASAAGRMPAVFPIPFVGPLALPGTPLARTLYDNYLARRRR